MPISEPVSTVSSVVADDMPENIANISGAAPRDCVYTTLIGAYEPLNEQPAAASSRLPFICFTDDPDLRSDSWEMRLVEPVFPTDSVRSQRTVKLLAHDYLPDFDRSLYIDNSVVLKRDPEEILAAYLGDAGLSLFEHGFRATVLDEFIQVARTGLDDQARIFEQLNHYSVWHPDVLKETPLWTGMLMRDHRREDVRRMMAIWRDHVLRYSRRDQLSVTVAMRQAGLEVTPIKVDNWDSWFHSWPHKEGRVPYTGLRASDAGNLPTQGLLPGLQAENEASRSVIKELRDEVRQREARIAALESSTSWRVTAPLRFASVAARSPVRSLRKLAAKWRRRAPLVLSPDESANAELFDREGYLGPVRLFTGPQCGLILRHFREVAQGEAKDLAVRHRFFHDVATRPQIRELLRPLLGEDIVLWGASVVERDPGQKHACHTDIESSLPEGGFVSIWIGLEGTSRDSALRLVTGSHKVGRPLQQEAHMRSVARGEATDAMLLDWCREADVQAEMIQPDMADGDALIFDGRLWHGSDNCGQSRRSALLLQYARADVPIAIQQHGNVDWPFKFTANSPRKLPVSGCAAGPALPADRESLDTVIRSGTGYVADRKGWIPYPILRGATPNASEMESHVSVLSPGNSPHPPHCHLDEELLIVLDGEAEIVIPEGADPEGARIERMRPGSFVYYPAYQYHTIRNVSASPVTYLMYRWHGAPKEAGGPLRMIVQHANAPALDHTQQGQAMRPLFEGETGFLSKLHCHETVMGAGAGYPAHEDAHDVAIVVLEGAVEANGQRLGPGGTAFHPAGTSHGLANPGADPARYLVFEFHRGV